MHVNDPNPLTRRDARAATDSTSQARIEPSALDMEGNLSRTVQNAIDVLQTSADALRSRGAAVREARHAREALEQEVSKAHPRDAEIAAAIARTTFERLSERAAALGRTVSEHKAALEQAEASLLGLEDRTHAASRASKIRRLMIHPVADTTAVGGSFSAAQARIDPLSRKLESAQMDHEDALGERRRAGEAYETAKTFWAQANGLHATLQHRLGLASAAESRARRVYVEAATVHRDPARSALRGVMTDTALARVLEAYLDIPDSDMRERTATHGTSVRYLDIETLLSAVAEVARAVLLGPARVRAVVDMPFVHADSIGQGFRVSAHGPDEACDANTSLVSIEVPDEGPPRIVHVRPHLAGQTS